MPELIIVGGLLLAAIVAAFVIEGWYVAHNETTISNHMQDMAARTPKQLILLFGIIIGLLVGWFGAHFTTICGPGA